MFNVIAYQIAENIDFDQFEMAFADKFFYASPSELFYKIDQLRYVSVFKYGVVCFFNYEEKGIDEFIEVIYKFCINFFYDGELTKEYLIENEPKETKFGFKKATIEFVNSKSVRLIMRNIAKSVALDNYLQHAKLLLEGTNRHVSLLEAEGKISISNKKLKKFIGETHHLKNQIVANLRLLDAASEIGQNDYLIGINNRMEEVLFLQKRTKTIYEGLEIINEHLESFREIIVNGVNLKLAWIEIVLLATFVIDIIVERCF